MKSTSARIAISFSCSALRLSDNFLNMMCSPFCFCFGVDESGKAADATFWFICSICLYCSVCRSGFRCGRTRFHVRTRLPRR